MTDSKLKPSFLIKKYIMPTSNPEHIIDMTKRLVESDKRTQIRLTAHGGNSLLIVCDPQEEASFIAAIKSKMESDTYAIINLNDLIIQYIESEKQTIEELFDLLKGSIPQIFKAPSGDSYPDLFRFIIEQIKEAFNQNKIPVLIRSGALFGSGIDNIHIIEDEVVMKSHIPLVILYPATYEGKELMFLSKRPASNYRCMIVNEKNN